MKTPVPLTWLVIGACACAPLVALAQTAKEPAPQDSPPEIPRASVTLPYTELRTLWEAARANREPKPKAEEPPPIPWIIHDAEIGLQLNDGAVAIEGAFDAQSFGSKWQTIPLIGGDVALNAAEAGERTIIWDDGYAALSRQEEKLHANLHLTGGLRGSLDKGATLRLKLPAATIKRLSVSGLPPGVEVTVDNQRALGAAKGGALFALESQAQEIVIRFASTPKRKATLPSQWKIESQVLAVYSDGRLHLDNRVFARAEDGSADELELLFPRAASGIAVTGDDLAEWRLVRSDEGFRRVAVTWKTPDQLDREITIAYTIPQSPLDPEWTIPSIATAETKEPRNFFVVVTAEAVELSAAALRYAGESRLLPEWMRPQVGALPFATAEGSAALALHAKWLPELKTAEAHISQSSCALRLVADGSLELTADYTVCHQAALPWQLDLPPDVELLFCEVDGHSMRPLLRGENRVELHLPAPGESRRGETKVTLVYAAKLKPLDPVAGELTLELPRTGLFIDHLDWTISIPDTYEPTAVSGNLSATTPTTDARGQRDERMIALRKDLCRGEKPVAEIFYQRRGVTGP